MAKRASELCMLCGEAPCSCGKPAAKKRAPKTAPSAPIQTVTLHAPPPVKLAVPPPVATGAQMRPPLTRTRGELTDTQLLEVGAIQALEPLLSNDERERYQKLLAVQLDSEERLRLWRLRHVPSECLDASSSA